MNHYPAETRDTNRYEKIRLRVAKFYAKLKDTRTDFLHKLSTKIIRENQTIVLEVRYIDIFQEW